MSLRLGHLPPTNQTLGHFPAAGHAPESPSLTANHAPESPSLTENLQRLLQSNNNNNGSGSSGGTTNEGSLLFFGMILFLFFIAFACFPFCYRKRRNNTGGLARPGTARSAASGPTTSRQTPRQPASAPPVPVKKVDFVKRLDKTTMEVSPKDLIRRDESQRITGGIVSMPEAASEGGDDGQKENGGPVLFDIELGNDMSAALSEAFADNTVLRLPKGKPNGDRLVPSTCAICLSNYRPGENVSWSSNPRCQHAFHTSCMVKYAEAATLKKRKEGKDAPVACPLCRNSFISEQGKEHDHKI